jgi:hypothetical protein
MHPPFPLIRVQRLRVLAAAPYLSYVIVATLTLLQSRVVYFYKCLSLSTRSTLLFVQLSAAKDGRSNLRHLQWLQHQALLLMPFHLVLLFIVSALRLVPPQDGVQFFHSLAFSTFNRAQTRNPLPH